MGIINHQGYPMGIKDDWESHEIIGAKRWDHRGWVFPAMDQWRT